MSSIQNFFFRNAVSFRNVHELQVRVAAPEVKPELNREQPLHHPEPWPDEKISFSWQERKHARVLAKHKCEYNY